MPVSDANKKAKIFVLVDLPDRDTVFGVLGPVTIFGPQAENFTLKEVRAQFVTAFAATNAAEDTLIDLILAEFDDIWLTEITVTEDAGTKGPNLFDSDSAMNKLRRRLSVLIGIYVPDGGFFADFKRISRIRSGPIR